MFWRKGLETRQKLIKEQQIYKCHTMEKRDELMQENQQLKEQVPECQIKNNVVGVKNDLLSQEIRQLQLKVENLQNSLQGERVLESMYRSLQTDKDTMKKQTEALRKQLQKLNKQKERERPLEVRCTVMTEKKEEVSQERSALRSSIGAEEDIL
ncbi:hypothetical protein D9C73_024260 [Collichthys lucidus]|uniref:Uncharacterized protein n=1 Tax=Collichthys lucidus TaxID=240159 RepID=A0A4U5VQA2_COLLU|nr:hypothetical protein D9C73_024260 [Collichthys lucidus]